MDANAKIGKPFIRMDPNKMSNNGRIMLDMFERQNLVIANTLEMCDGTITRERIVENKAEKSAIDYIVMCEELLEHLIEMSIDESRINVLSRYRKTKDGIKRVVLSDHNPLFSKFSITFNRRPVIIRKEYFRFKCEESKKRFHDETSTTSKLSSCFRNETNFDSSAKLFHRTLNKTVHKCFKKVRIKSGKNKFLGDKIIQDKMKLAKKLKLFLWNNKCKIGNKIAQNKLKEVEDQIVEIEASKNAEIVREHIDTVETLDGNFSHMGMWKLKQKLCPIEGDPPMAKHDDRGNLITSPEALKHIRIV